MLAHRLRHRVTFQALQVEVDSDGYRRETWHNVWLDSDTELANVPAEVLTGPGRDFVGSAAPQAETSARINVRWFPVDARALQSWRVLWDGGVYSITSVETDLTARREWRLRVVAGPREGL